MKKTLIILSIIILCVSCINNSTNNENQSNTIGPKLTKWETVSFENIEHWCYDDTLHNKIFCFSNPYCGGCIYQFKNYFKDALAKIDTSQWRVYFLIAGLSPDEISNLNEDEIEKRMHKLGVPEGKLYFWPYGIDSATYKKVTNIFKATNTVSSHFQGVPRCYAVDRHGYLAIIKTYDSPKKEHYTYELRSFDTYLLEEDNDYSKIYKGSAVITKSY